MSELPRIRATVRIVEWSGDDAVSIGSVDVDVTDRVIWLRPAELRSIRTDKSNRSILELLTSGRIVHDGRLHTGPTQASVDADDVSALIIAATGTDAPTLGDLARARRTHAAELHRIMAEQDAITIEAGEKTIATALEAVPKRLRRTVMANARQALAVRGRK